MATIIPQSKKPSPSQTSTTTPIKMPSNMTALFGKPGETFVNAYLKEEKRLDDLKITDYRKMLDNDGLIQMLWNAIVNTIMAAGFKVDDDDDVETEQASEEQQFIEKVLFTPEWKGGMSIDFETTTRTMLRAFIEGYRVFEVVWKNGEDGKFYVDKLAPRAGKTDAEFYLIVDDAGMFTGFRQRVSFMSQVNDIIVKNEGALKKVVKATYGEEFGSAYGRSGFRAAWYHYDKAHKGMYLNHIGHELGAVKYRNFKHKLNDAAKVQKVVDDLGKVGLESVGAFNINEGELFFEDVADAGVMGVGKEMIIMHYSLMAKSLLAQFIDLGSNGSSGNRSLGESQMAFFKQGLQAIGTVIIEQTWNQVIADLIKANFNRDIYPKLCLNPIDDAKSTTILSAFIELVKNGSLSDTLMNELQSEAAEKLNLDVTDEQIQTDMAQKKTEEQAKQQFDQKMQQSQLQQTQKLAATKSLPVKATDIHLDDMSGMNVDPNTMYAIDMTRPLYPDENKVKLADIKRKLVNSESDAKDILRSKLEAQKDGIVSQYITAMRQGKKAIAKATVTLEDNTTDYSQELVAIAEDLLNYGKVGAANELNMAIPITAVGDHESLLANIQLIISDQESRLDFRLKQLANKALASNMPENQLRLLMEQEVENFINVTMPPTVDAIVPTYLNLGRGITFSKYSAQIFAYRYTAVLDNRTTEYCRSMDGRVFQSNDPEYAMVTPPNHYGCRSIWTPITNTESEGVVVDGKPSDLPIYGSLSTFRDLPSMQTSDQKRGYHQHLKKPETFDLSEDIKEVEHILNTIDRVKKEANESKGEEIVDNILNTING